MSKYFKLSVHPRLKFTVPPVPVNCKWGDWSTGQCSRSCGGGQRTKTRKKTVEEKHGGTCTGTASDSEACNTQGCSGNRAFVILKNIYLLAIISTIVKPKTCHFSRAILKIKVVKTFAKYLSIFVFLIIFPKNYNFVKIFRMKCSSFNIYSVSCAY